MKKFLILLIAIVFLLGLVSVSSVWAYGGGGGSSTYPTNTSVVVNSGAATAIAKGVTLGLSATNATEMIISEDSNFTGASWQSYSSSASFTLSTGNGVKIVYVKYKSSSGLASGVVSDSITLDETGTGSNVNTTVNTNTTNTNTSINTNGSTNTNFSNSNTNSGSGSNSNSAVPPIITKVEVVRGGGEGRIDLKLEKEGIKVLSALTKSLPKKVEQWEVVHWVAYGDENSDKLTLEERKAALADYYSLYGKLPVSDEQWVDLLTVAGFGGDKPKQRNLKNEIVGIRAFNGIYKKLPSTSSDWKFVNWIAYRMHINPAAKDALKEKTALQAFNKLKYAGKPLVTSSLGQAIIRALAYVGL